MRGSDQKKQASEGDSYVRKLPRLLIFIVDVEQVVEEAPASEALHECDPADSGNEYVSPSGIKLGSEGAEPPHRECKPQNPIYPA